MKEKINEYSNKILMIFKEGLEMSDVDMMNLIKIENILAEFATLVPSNAKGAQKKGAGNDVSVVTFTSALRLDKQPNFQYWRRSENRVVIDQEMSKNPLASVEDYTAMMYGCHAVLKETNEAKLRKELTKQIPDIHITSIEVIDLEQLKQIPIFMHLKM